MTRFIAKYIFASLLVALTPALTACHSSDTPEPTGPAPRTVLVYQVADNNLGDDGWDRADIKEMFEAAKAGHIGRNRLLVYNSRNTGTALLEIKAAGIDTLLKYGTDLLSVSTARMKQVLADTRRLAPAGSYGLVLWSHGTGWIQDGIADPLDQPKPRSFGWDTNGEKMNITTLARTLEPEGLDFIYFDCCYMGSIETLYELRDCAPKIVGSPTELPLAGMPYHNNIAPFFAPVPDLIGAATNTFNNYNSLTGIDRTCTMVVVETAALPALAAATKAIYEKVTDTYPAGYVPQRYENKTATYCSYFDFRHYIHSLCTDSDGNPRFEGAAPLLADFDKAFDAAVLYSAATPMLWNAVALSDANGLSTYILRRETSATTKNYNTLGWYTDVASSLKFN